jgi:hypothetical protein
MVHHFDIGRNDEKQHLLKTSDVWSSVERIVKRSFEKSLGTSVSRATCIGGDQKCAGRGKNSLCCVSQRHRYILKRIQAHASYVVVV